MKNKPVTAYLNGGIGNQLFIWAAAYEISKRNQTDLNLNITNINGRDYGLREFNLDPHGISVTLPKSYQFKNVLLKRLWILANRRNHYYERSFEYCPEVSRMSSGISIHGYFQSSKYFCSSFDEIRRQLNLRKPSDAFLRYESAIRSDKSLAIHIRRGDYSNPNSYHKILKADYYHRAISCVPNLGLKTYIFTDDLEWARRTVDIDATFITSYSLNSPAENLVLMSKADYLIGANSTFSLWAGLLSNPHNQNPIFPRNWFDNGKLSSKDLMPLSFELIDN